MTKKTNTFKKILAGLAVTTSVAAATTIGATTANAQTDNDKERAARELRSAQTRLTIADLEMSYANKALKFVDANGTLAQRRDSLANMAFRQLDDAAVAMFNRGEILNQVDEKNLDDNARVIFSSLAPTQEYVDDLIAASRRNFNAADSLNTVIRKNMAKAKTR